MDLFEDKSILITGGTGTLGQECIKTLLSKHNPRRVIVYSRDEFKQSEMAYQYNQDCMRFFLGDIRDKERLFRAFDDVDFVIHTAALKQVDKCEYDPDEVVKTNILGTQNVIDAAIFNNVKKVILISTDKAVNPISLYGSTKLAAEKLFVAANNLVGKRDTLFSVVRLGNILNSRGSVLPLYNKLISQGQAELPLTDIRMTRFIITAGDCAEFILKSFNLVQGGETLIPKMPSITIVNLIHALKKQFKIIGMRPGEKLHEELCQKELSSLTLDLGDYFLIKPTTKLVKQINFNIGIGELVGNDFSYTSENNPIFLKIDEIRGMINNV